MVKKDDPKMSDNQNDGYDLIKKNLAEISHRE